MAEHTPNPKNIFELINLNVYNTAQDVAQLYNMVREIHSALFSSTESIAPDSPDKQ
jgi:hypothetical protein